MINKKSKIYIAGHKGMVGSAILRKLKSKGFTKLIFSEKKSIEVLVRIGRKIGAKIRE